ncbi:TIGR04104 family putative zinc finger protein [Bacillus sp. FJAT-45037]|uniref:TIGR04104 family putative zinc finger protein n=1 Tax=Bacillus sp. FJAT-45037 TaxID=2011007 RepID=UPI003FA4836E
MAVLQKCENCNEQFSWSKIYKSFWWAYKPINCDKCGKEHRITIIGRFTFTFLTIVPMLIFGNFLSPFSNFFMTLTIGFAILMIGSLFAPYFVKYTRVL